MHTLAYNSTTPAVCNFSLSPMLFFLSVMILIHNQNDIMKNISDCSNCKKIN